MSGWLTLSPMETGCMAFHARARMHTCFRHIPAQPVDGLFLFRRFYLSSTVLKTEQATAQTGPGSHAAVCLGTVFFYVNTTQRRLMGGKNCKSSPPSASGRLPICPSTIKNVCAARRASQRWRGSSSGSLVATYSCVSTRLHRVFGFSGCHPSSVMHPLAAVSRPLFPTAWSAGAVGGEQDGRSGCLVGMQAR